MRFLLHLALTIAAGVLMLLAARGHGRNMAKALSHRNDPHMLEYYSKSASIDLMWVIYVAACWVIVSISADGAFE